MLSRRLLRPLSLWLALTPALTPALAAADELLRGTVESLRQAESAVLAPVELLSGPLLAELYAARAYRSAWNDPAQVEALLAAIEDSAAHGLSPADFQPGVLRPLAEPGRLGSLPPGPRLAAELKLSDALLRYVYQIRFGRLDPEAVSRAWNHRPPIAARTLVEAALAVLDSAEPGRALAEAAPRPFFYENLRRALGALEGEDPTLGLPPVAEGKAFGLGTREPRVAQLRNRLRALGDLKTQDQGDPERFDAGLRDALIAFQSRHGLTDDGVAGAATLRAVNRPRGRGQAEKLRINLERMRWFYDDLPGDYVLVDVAGFMAHVVRDGRVSYSTRVVVGTPKDQTPSFRDEMEHVVFNPTWTVPPSIQKTMRGAGSRYKVVDRRTGRAVSGANVSDFRRYSLIQAAGPGNALGRVKFIFPNNQAVYLHDTPSKGLFSQTVRAFSHGCVRVHNPLKLAEVILDSPSWGQSAIDRVVGTSQTRFVHLKERLPVILYYLTAMADEQGRPSLRGDIYGRDRALEQAFAGPPSAPRIGFPKFEPIPAPAAPDPAGPGPRAPAGDAPRARPPLTPVSAPAPRVSPAGLPSAGGSPSPLYPPPSTLALDVVPGLGSGSGPLPQPERPRGEYPAARL
jgi:murein L,D-transpeptidase YcbB/YkuD